MSENHTAPKPSEITIQPIEGRIFVAKNLSEDTSADAPGQLDKQREKARQDVEKKRQALLYVSSQAETVYKSDGPDSEIYQELLKTHDRLEAELTQLETLAGISDSDRTEPSLATIDQVTASESSDTYPGPLPDGQPRRVRQNGDGPIEQLVKFSDKDFKWQSAEAHQAKLEEKVLTAITEAIDEGAEEDSKQNSIIAELRADLRQSHEDNAALREDNRALNERIDSLDRKLAELVTLLEKKNSDEQGQTDVTEPEVSPEFAQLREDLTEKHLGAQADVDTEADRADVEADDEADQDVFYPEISEHLENGLRSSRDSYAELTAKHRDAYWGQFLKSNGWLANALAKVKPFKWAADQANQWFGGKELDQAREKYENALNQVKNLIAGQYFEHYEDSPETRKLIRQDVAQYVIAAENQLEHKILEDRMNGSKKTNRFVNWWVRNDSLGGKIKKYGILFGSSAAVGAVAGIVGLPLLIGGAGSVIAGAGGAYLGHYVTKRRANAFVEKGGDVTLAQEQADIDSKNKATYINDQAQDVDIAKVVNMTEQRTATEKRDNRFRVKGTAGAVGGGFGAGSAFGNAINAGLNQLGAQPVQPQGAGQAAVEATKTLVETQPKLTGVNFDIESGSGYVNELQEFATNNGHSLDSDQAVSLHNYLRGMFSDKYINGTDIYYDGGDVRLANSGAGSWVNGVPNAIRSWMISQGLW